MDTPDALRDCLRCRRPRSLCICSAICTVPNRTGVTVVQHPGERDHPFNTARLAVLSLERADLITAWEGTIERPDLPEGAAVLYPAPGAPILGEGAEPTHLVVLDGTWPQAKALYRENPWMAELPAVAIAPTQPSTYRIRREPAEHCLSTIEAITAALKGIEPDTDGLDGLLSGFDALVDGQIAELSRRERSPRRLRRAGKNRETVRQRIDRRWADVVVLYAETTPVRGQAKGRGIDVLQLAAVRPATGELFDVLATVRETPDDHLLGHMGLDAGEVHGAGSFEDLQARWAAFAGAQDLYVAWSQAGAKVALQRLGLTDELVHLKPLYCNLRGPRAGRPDQIVEREELSVTPVAVRGRAADRLANAVALAGFLREPSGDDGLAGA